MTAGAGLSRYLTARDGQIRLDIPDGALPPFLIEAFNVAQVPDPDKARALMAGWNLEHVHAIANRGVPEDDLIRLIIAVTLQKVSCLDQALEWYERIAERNALVLNEQAVIHRHLGRIEQAIACRQQAIDLDPDNVGLCNNLAMDLMHAGRLQEGLDLLRAAVDRCPSNAWLHSNLLLMMHYVPGVTRQEIFEEHCRWGLRHTPLSRARTRHDNDPSPDRPLRVGYVSADLCRHSVAATFELLLDGHDRQAFEIHGYANVARPDDVTQRLAAKFDQYHNVYGLDDRAVADRIVQDRIDVLVAVAGHTQGNRLIMLGYRPAPIQVDMGWIATLGMRQVDLRLTDAVLDPAEDARYYLEQLAPLAGGYVSFRGPDAAPQVGPLPLRSNGFVTFGSFANPMKISSLVLGLWACVLKSVRDSRMILKLSGGDDPWLQRHFRGQFERLGVAAERILILGRRSPAEHLGLYNRVDIALDTYPFSGCVTTLEGLWMGVPIVTLTGPEYVSRPGQTILHRLGMDGLVATCPDDYVAKAVALAGHSDALSRIRGALRRRMMASPVCDGYRFAAEVEAVYRAAWRKWCETQNTEHRTQNSEGGRGARADSIA
jgi:predicted O-linked N-acetylglucosamine transferase (SPINDLY family)